MKKQVEDWILLADSDLRAEKIIIASKDWLDLNKINELNDKISQKPIHIDNCQQIREINRSKSY